jgi:hypothetical protein
MLKMMVSCQRVRFQPVKIVILKEIIILHLITYL